jgi:hypothetical protein
MGYVPDYHIEGLRRGEWPNPWIWEIFYHGKPLEVRVWGGYFRSYNAARRAGQPALDELLTQLKKKGTNA